jgi:hypothetical protein
VSFAGLDPAERVASVERHLAQQPPLPGAPRLSIVTLEQLRRVELAIVDDDVTDERFLALVDDWNAYLATLSEHDQDAASYALRRFTQVAEGLRGPAREEAEPEA